MITVCRFPPASGLFYRNYSTRAPQYFPGNYSPR